MAGGAAAALTTITTSADTVSVTGAVDLNARSLAVDSTNAGGSGAGANITFNNTIDGTGTLTLTGGTLGDVTITGATGNGTALAALTITGNDISVGDIGGAAAGVSGATSITAANGAGPDAGSITLTGTTYNQNQLTLNAGAATNAIQVAGGAAAALTTITTSADTVTVTGAVDLNARSLTVDSTNAGGSGAGANITFNNTIDGAGTLTLTGGTLGDMTITGTTGAGTALSSLVITGNDISVGDIGAAAAGVTNATSITAADGAGPDAGSITLTGTTYNQNQLTLNAGAATNAIQVAGGAAAALTTITTSGDTVTMTGAVDLNARNLTVDSTNAAGTPTGANISFDNTINGAGTLMLKGGTTGNITFTGAVGGTTRLSNLIISNSNDFLASSTLSIGTLTQNAGSGTTTFNGSVDTNVVGGVALTGNNQTLNANLTTTNGGPVTFTNTGLLTLNANVTSDGAVIQNGAGAATITGSRTISTTSDAVDFLRAVTLNGSGSLVTINTTTSGTGANITFQSTLNATTAAPNAEDLTLTAGTGSVTFTGVVGGGTRLGDIIITSANNVTETAGLSATTLTQSAGSGTTTFNGAVDTSAVGGVSLTGNAQTLNASLTTTNNGPVTFTNAGLLTINGNVISDGAVTQNGAGAATITGSRTISTTSDNVDFLRAVTLNGSGSTVAINTAASGPGANITFQNTLNATTAAPNAEDLTLTAGTTGNILFTGLAGTVARLGDVSIVNANDVTVTAGLTAASLRQTAGQGTTRFNGPINADTITGVQIATNNITTGASGTITTTAGSAGVVTLTNSGTLDINAAINADGNVTQNGVGSTTLNADIITSADLVQFAQPVLLTGNRLIDTTAASPSVGSGGTINFLNTVNGATNSLTLAAPTASGDISFSQTANNLTGLTVTSGRNFTTASTAPITVAGGGVSVTVGGTVTLNGSLTTTGSGAVTITNGGLFTLNNNIVSDGAVTQNGAGAATITGSRTISTTSDNVDFLRAVTLNGSGSLVAINTTASGTGANITFQNTLNATTAGANAEDLTLTAGTGNITFTGAVGGTRLGDVIIASSNNVTETAGLTATTLTQSAGSGTTTFNGAVNTNAAGGVALTGTTLTVNAGITTTGNGLVTVVESGLATFAAAGDIAADGAVSLTANGGITTAGDITTTNDNVTYVSATNLTGPVVVNAGTGAITFTGTVNGAQTLTANSTGTTTFTSAVGGTTALTSLTTNAGGTTAINGGAVTTTGAQNYNDAVTLNAATTLSTTNSNVTFASTLNSANATARDLTVNAGTGAITTTGVVGGTNALGAVTFNSTGTTTLTSAVTAGSLTTNVGGTTAINGATVTTTGAQSYNDAVTLGANTTLTGVGHTFANTVNGLFSLTVNDSATTTFTGSVGATNALTSLTTNAGGTTAINGATVKTSGAQTYNDSVTLGAGTTLTGTTMTFTGTLAGATNSLGITGNAVFGDAAADAVTGLSTLGVSGTTRINTDTVTTSGAQTYTGAVTLGADTTLTSTGAGNVTFANTINGAQALTVNTAGTTFFNAAVGGTTALASVTTDAAGTVAINGGTVTTTGTQTYNDAMTLNASTTLTTTNSAVTLGSALDSFDTTPRDLAVNSGNGLITLGGTVGATHALGAVTFNSVGVRILGGNISTLGAQTYVGVVLLGADTILTTSNGAVAFNSTLDSTTATPRDMIVNAGTGPITFTGAVGTSHQVGAITLNSTGATTLSNTFNAVSLMTDAAGTTALNGGAVTTTGAQTYNDVVTLNAPGATTTLTGTDVFFAGTVRSVTDGVQALTVSGSGITTFTGAVGDNSQRLLSLTTNNGGTTVINGGSVTTLGAQTYADAVTLDAITNTTTFTGTDITFGSTLRSLTDAEETLVVNGNGTTTFGGAVGDNNQRLAALTSTTTGSTAIGGNVTTAGIQTYNDDVRIDNNVVLTTTNSAVTFTDDIDSQAAEANNLTINTGSAATTIAGDVGSAPGGALGTLTINNTATTGMALPATNALALSVTTNGPVTNFGNLAITNGAIVNAGTNAITLGTSPTAIANFGSLNVTGGVVNVTEASGTVLTGVSATTLNLTSAGSITDVPGTAINVSGVATFDAGANDISLGGKAGTLTNIGRLKLTGAAIDVTQNNAMVVSGTASVSMKLTGVGVDLAGINTPLLGVFSTGPLGITDSAPTNVIGLAVFDAGGYNITLDETLNDFNNVQLSGASVIFNDVNASTLSAVLASGPFNARSFGDFTVTAPMTGLSNITVTSITGAIAISAPVISQTGNIAITAPRSITSTAPIAANGATGTITIKAGGDAVLADLKSAGGSVTVTAGGSSRFTSPMLINGPFTVTSNGITFDGALTGNSSTGDLLANTTGVTRFSSSIGAGSPLHNLTTNAGGTTVLGNGTLQAVTINFNDAVVLEQNTTVTATNLRFGNVLGGASDGGQGLTLNVSGDSVLVGAVGTAGLRLANLTTDAAGRTLINGGSIFTSGAQTYNDKVLLGANTTITPGSLTFNDTLNTGTAGASSAFDSLVDGSFKAASSGESDLVANVSGATIFNALVGQTGRLGDVTTDAPGSTTIRADFNATKTIFNDAVTFETAAAIKIDTTNTQLYGSTVQLNSNLSFVSTAASTTEGISFAQGLTGAGRTLDLKALQGTITSAGSVGTSSGRLTTVAAAGRNVIFGGDIFSEGNITLAPGTANSSAQNDFIQFTVPGSTTASNTTIDSKTGEIILGSGATTGTTAKTEPPLRASIFKSNPGDLYLFAHKVTIQPFERLAVRSGSLVVIADGTAAGDGITLSNTSVSDNLVLVGPGVSTSAITLRSRGAAPVIDQANATVQDNGTDLIGGAVLFFNSSFGSSFPTRTRYSPKTGDPAFFDYKLNKGNIPPGTGPLFFTILGDATGVKTNVFVADLVTTNTFRPILPNLAYLDLSTVSGFATYKDGFIGPEAFGTIPTSDAALRTIVSNGAAPRNTLEQAFTPNVPRGDTDAAPPEADLAAAVREQLQALGIYARALTKEERLARERLAAIFVTVPKKVRPSESDYEVADARVEDRAVRDVIRNATETGLIGESQAKLDAVALALASSYSKFELFLTRSSKDQELEQEVLVKEYREWLDASDEPDAKAVLAYLKALRTTLKKIEQLGLTTQELDGSKAQIYGSVLRARLNVEPEFFQALVEKSGPAAAVAGKGAAPAKPAVHTTSVPAAAPAEPVIN
ncbi:MAG: hypothetical protein WCR49_00640 [Opitutae bacterium]